MVIKETTPHIRKFELELTGGEVRQLIGVLNIFMTYAPLNTYDLKEKNALCDSLRSVLDGSKD